MKMPIAIIVLSIGCAVSSVRAQPSPPVARVNIDEFIGPFTPTPESAAEERKEAYAAYAWFSRICRETQRGAEYAQCMRQVRQDRDQQLAMANSRRR